ncbi:MAG: hypothetical protein R3B47_16625 [Bacteroidia bacterium]
MLLHPLAAQQSHTEVVKALYTELAGRIPSAGSVEIDSLEGISAGILVEKGKKNLKVDFPDVSYKKIAAERYQRSIGINYQLSDSTGMQGGTLVKTDTLDIAVLRRMRREAPSDLKGGPVTGFGKLLRPVAIVAGSIGAIIVLFQLRTK